MAAERGQEFEIRIAKAKDLPLSWFDLVLRPEKFQQHIKTLEDNPNSELLCILLTSHYHCNLCMCTISVSQLNQLDCS